jgi:hypothetical protein
MSEQPEMVTVSYVEEDDGDFTFTFVIDVPGVEDE